MAYISSLFTYFSINSHIGNNKHLISECTITEIFFFILKPKPNQNFENKKPEKKSDSVFQLLFQRFMSIIYLAVTSQAL